MDGFPEKNEYHKDKVTQVNDYLKKGNCFKKTNHYLKSVKAARKWIKPSRK